MTSILNNAVVAERLFKQLLPAESAGFLVDFAKILVPGEDSAVYDVKFSPEFSQILGDAAVALPSISPDLMAVAKRVASAAVSALLKELEKVLPKERPAQGSQQHDTLALGLGEVGKLIANLKGVVPLVAKLAAAYGGKSFTATNNSLTQPVAEATFYQVGYSSASHFIAEIQRALSGPSSAGVGELGGTALGFNWDTLKKIGNFVVDAAAGALPVIIPIIQKRLAPSPTAALRAQPDVGASDAGATVARQAANYTTCGAIKNNYKQSSFEPAVRGVQAVIQVGKELHYLALKQTGALTMSKADGDAWWSLFEKCVQNVAPTVSQFNLQERQDPSLDDSSSVHAMSVSGGLVSGAHVLSQHFAVHYAEVLKNNGEFTAADLNSFWDKIKSAATVAAGVIQQAAPIAAQLLPLIL